ncbi:hypothetical protein [Chitinophaga deserti]|uniref:hypothetical protein n=1 Tax=Chitinophaga deserti TaxID=2164099 RepID=UPI0013007C7A|nr:hypothetical protein [Chitinophaga deserti]
MAGLFSGLTPGIQIAMLASSLIGIHFHKGSLPANGAAFISGIPVAAWNLFVLGAFIILILFGIHETLEQMQTERYTFENYTKLSLQLHNWLKNILGMATLMLTPFIAIRIYLKGIGYRLNAELRSSYFASAIVLYCWIQVLQTFVYVINQFITTPIALAISAEMIQYTLMGAVSVFVYLFGMLPAAAITSGIVAPETDIQFEGETETKG